MPIDQEKKPTRGNVGICPHVNCNRKAQQIALPTLFYPEGHSNLELDISATRCSACKQLSYWKAQKLLYPFKRKSTPAANRDMPEDIFELYQEASDIYDSSPRSAAALLRLAVSKLCDSLGLSSEKLEDYANALNSEKYPAETQALLQGARIIDDKTNPPGSINLAVDNTTAHTLFFSLNQLTEKLISEKKKAADNYDYLKAGKVS